MKNPGREDCAGRLHDRIAGYCGAANDAEADVRDVLTDLMHYCAHQKMDFGAALESARNHFAAERFKETGS